MPASFDADLQALLRTIDALIDKAPPPGLAEASHRSADDLRAKVEHLCWRAEALPPYDRGSTRTQYESLLTDGCAEVIDIEVQRLRTKGRIVTLLAVDDAHDSHIRMDELRDRYRLIVDELSTLRMLLTAIRARLDGEAG